MIFGGEIHDWGMRNGGSANGGPFAYACAAWGHCARPSTEGCNPLAHCSTCQAARTEAGGLPLASSNMNDCLTCEQGYRFNDLGYGDCTGTCEPELDNSQHYVGQNLNNYNGANGEYQGMTNMADWSLQHRNTRVPDPQEMRCCAQPWEWRSGEKNLEQCRTECLNHPECVGIEFCGPDIPGTQKHSCDSNECILLSSTLDGHSASGWNVYVHNVPGQAPPAGGGH